MRRRNLPKTLSSAGVGSDTLDEHALWNGCLRRFGIHQVPFRLLECAAFVPRAQWLEDGRFAFHPLLAYQEI